MNRLFICSIITLSTVIMAVYGYGKGGFGGGMMYPMYGGFGGNYGFGGGVGFGGGGGGGGAYGGIWSFLVFIIILIIIASIFDFGGRGYSKGGGGYDSGHKKSSWCNDDWC